jgi:Predicted acyltransferase
MLVEGKFLSYNDDLTDAFEIRKQVFQLEQGVKEEEEFDDLDKEAVHVVIYIQQKAVATGRLLFDGDTFRIGRVAVLQEERGKQYGDFVVRMLMDRAFNSGAKEIFISAQIQTKGFYEKIGFQQDGEEFIEAGIRHIPMKIEQNHVCKGCQS